MFITQPLEVRTGEALRIIGEVASVRLEGIQIYSVCTHLEIERSTDRVTVAKNLWNELQGIEVISLRHRQTATDAEQSDPDFVWTNDPWAPKPSETEWDSGPSDLEWHGNCEVSITSPSPNVTGMVNTIEGE
ncbi:hypothetical protein PG993_003910 [Apiospora rasikravindrae]|uniref:Uncharacterized protein n=1 Tax=Apiospora rasikravindrae TaxID=990691 RepID=A0ABR1U0U3_9PEZI